MNNQEFMDSLVDFVGKTFNSHGMLMPMFILIDNEDRQHIFMAPFTSDAEKDLTALVIRQEIQDKKAVRMAFVAEAWFVSPSADISEEEAMKIRPSEQPDRKEAIQISVEDRDGQGESAMIPIERDAKGNGKLGECKRYQTTSSKGRFAHLFGERVLN